MDNGENTSWNKLKRARKADQCDQLEQDEEGLELANKRRRVSLSDGVDDDFGPADSEDGKTISANGILDTTSSYPFLPC